MSKLVKPKRKLLVKKENIRNLLSQELTTIKGGEGWLDSWLISCVDEGSEDSCPPCAH
jgi:hypothetical protein